MNDSPLPSSPLTVRAPGSSANLGPGFDVLGLAVTLYCQASEVGSGAPCWEDHIARVAFETAGGQGSIWFDFDLPPSRGLGFSAAARAAGATLAFCQQGNDIETARRLAYEVVLELEGHGDNAAPAVFGGIHVIAGEVQHRLAAGFPADLLFWAMEARTETDESRSKLTDTLTRADAVFNMGRVALLVAAICEGDPTHLATATQDRIHQDARFLTRPRSEKARQDAMEAGALAAWLSGSGPTLGIACAPGTRDSIAEVMPNDGQVFKLDVDTEGCVLV